MPRISRARAIARSKAKWPNHSPHYPGSVTTLRTRGLPTNENFTTDDALEFFAASNDELGECYRRHMLVRAWMQREPRRHLQ